MVTFGSGTYGESFADVYDDWYGDISDADATARFVDGRCGDGPVLELGVGTGRLALPIARRGRRVVGIDASPSMLAVCRDAAAGLPVDLVRADLAALPVVGPFGAALCAFNTLFNLASEAEQAALFQSLRRCLAPDGVVVIEAITGRDLADGPSSSVGVSRIEIDRVVLSATALDADAQTITGQHIDITETGGVRLRPWHLRWTTPTQLDALAASAGLVLSERFADVDGTPFDENSDRHVSTYTRPPA